MTNHDEQMKAVARLVSGRPDWIDAPAVQAWHRSDGRTERDGTPGKPRIWSPDYRTTERWSTPSLQNVHWSDLVDVVPLAAPAGSYTRTESPDLLDGGMMCAAVEAEAASDTLLLVQQQRDQATARAEKAEQERDEARANARRASERWCKELTLRHEVADELRRLRATQTRTLTPDAISEAEWDQIAARAWEYWKEHMILNSHGLKRMMQAALSEPPARPEGAEDWEGWLIEAMPHESMPDEDIALLADRIAQRLNEERS